ncbi:TTL4 protein [Gonium pectorale]|uniref:TTL4 protein n=1 Tax=Gonium pectorale TaxID=33097 RepID=A0A150GDW8_GONPE|nr:TTL4 protein [Gonium pectorale]|eukprot:KXZ48029.1 TTL4 protein [Gonium pectorale]
MREALTRRPWWEEAAGEAEAWRAAAASRKTASSLYGSKRALAAAGGGGGGGPAAVAVGTAAAAPAAASPPRWNLWIGLNGQRFGEWGLLPPGPGGGGHGDREEETYVVSAGPRAVGGGGAALRRFRTAYSRHAAAGGLVWIAKPAALNRGNGIVVLNSLDAVMEHLKSRPEGSTIILQKYIERPLLLGGRKFDIRAYVLVDPHGGVWFHKESYCRTSSTPYDGSDLANRAAHLTNDAVQKHTSSYHAYEDHCKLPFAELGDALRRAAPAAGASQESRSSSGVIAGAPPAIASLDTTPGSEAGLWGAMRRCVAALFSVAGAAGSSGAGRTPLADGGAAGGGIGATGAGGSSGGGVSLLNPCGRRYCFELLGLDFMLDEEGRLYLIEVNTSPALFRAGAYLADLLPRVVEEVAQRAIDTVFPPPAPALPTAAGDGDEPAGGAVAVAPVVAAPLDGFVRVDLDPDLGAAAVAALTSMAAARGGGGRAAASGRAAAAGSAGGSSAPADVRRVRKSSNGCK